MEELEQEDDRDHNMERSDGRVPQAYMQKNIAQSIPPHLRHQFTLATVACIRRFERDSDQQMVENVTDTMRELLRKPPRSQPASGLHEDKHLELAEDAFEQQKQINKILTRQYNSLETDNKRRPLGN